MFIHYFSKLVCIIDKNGRNIIIIVLCHLFSYGISNVFCACRVLLVRQDRLALKERRVLKALGATRVRLETEETQETLESLVRGDCPVQLDQRDSE